MERDTLLRLFAALAEEGVDYVLIGGVAVNLHGIVRATEDVDLFLRPDPDNVARLRRALQRVVDDPEIEDISAEDLAGPYPVVRYVSPDAALVVNLIAALGERVAFAELESMTRELRGVPVRLATPAALYRLKRDTVRPIDAQDAERLRHAFAFEEDD
jgi:hypothetical protein